MYVEVGGVNRCLASKRHFAAKLYIVGLGGYPKREYASSSTYGDQSYEPLQYPLQKRLVLHTKVLIVVTSVFRKCVCGWLMFG